MASDQCPGKKSWPELVGVCGEIAAAKIEKENPNVDAIVKLQGTPVIQDYRCNRVWIWVNTHGVVSTVPHVG
ncbi:Proteinase inhibitor [Morus notabilis]|uniref:Proteinase inhibitor n=1 Tax=Morus notabilis TaxID=981085 RepID=W9S0M9_9ROSA|nr:Proteinase inhibitor [Morus notabilis]